MQEFIKSSLSLGIAASLFPLKQLENILTPTPEGEHKGAATKAMDAVASATVEQFGGVLRGTYSALDNIQRGLVSIGWQMLSPSGGGIRRTRRDGSRRTEEHRTNSATTETSVETLWPEAAPSDIAVYRVQRARPARSTLRAEEETPVRGNGRSAEPAGRRV